MVTLAQALFLGILQGLTEWLPVSSSGHLILAQRLFHATTTLSFTILLHFATMLVLLVFYRKDITSMMKAVLRRDFTSTHGKLLTYLIIGTIPIALVGYLFHDTISALFTNTLTTGIGFLITGTLLWLTTYAPNPHNSLTPKNTFLVGIAQAVAIIPGISRSGATIGTGLLLGIHREDVAKYSFLLAFPAILGATLLDLNQVAFIPLGYETLAGMIAAFLTGFLTLRWLTLLIKKGKIKYFSIYCLAIGILTLLFLT